MEYPKLISWSYRTGRGLFTSRNDKDFVLLFYVQNAETEAKIEQLGYIPSNPFGPEFPFVKVVLKSELLYKYSTIFELYNYSSFSFCKKY